MFGIGRLRKDVDEFALSLSRSSRSKDERLCELEAAIALFARKCDQCGQWKRIDAKGWMVREGEKRSLWGRCMGMYPGPDRYPADYLCPSCMAALKPVDAPEVVFRGDTPTCCVSLQGASKPEKRKGGKAKC